MIEWILWQIIFPLVPIPVVYIYRWMTNNQLGFVEILRDGQLCFYSTSLVALTIQETWGKDIVGQSFVIFGLFFCVVLSTGTYGIAVTHESTDPRKLAQVSIWTALVTVIIVVTTRLQVGP